MKIKGVLFAMTAAVIVFAACRNSNNTVSANIEAISDKTVSEETAARTDSVHRAAEAKLLRGLTNRKIESLDTIIPDFGGSDTKVVLVTSRFDCVSCVVAGFQAIDKIKKSAGPALKTYAVGITKEINYDIDKKYDGTVYEDKENKLHEELGYAPTPIIIVLMDGRIIDLHKPYDISSGVSKKFINDYSVK